MTISKDDQKNIDESVGKLLEHFDSVRIFVTRQNGERQETESYDTGGGNLYAQLGQIQEWLVFQNQYARTFSDRLQKNDGEE